MKHRKFVIALLFVAALSAVSFINTAFVPHARLASRQYLHALDTAGMTVFLRKYPLYQPFKGELVKICGKRQMPIWTDQSGLTGPAEILYSLARHIDEDGLPNNIPYQEQLDAIYHAPVQSDAANNDFMFSCLFLWYTQKVFHGLPDAARAKTGWMRNRNAISNDILFESYLQNPGHFVYSKHLFSQYYNLRKGLKKYRAIAANGGWEIIETEKGLHLQVEDVSPVIGLVRKRLFAEGYLHADSQKENFDAGLLLALTDYQIAHNQKPDSIISPGLISSLNVPVEERIRSIVVNMERCRWITPPGSEEFIVVNVPSYRLLYFSNGIPVLTSKVIVGKKYNRTVIFDADLTQIVFCPYWNIPASILKKEILPEIRKNPSLMASNRLEWHQGRLRQKPGPGNALGLVKFVFPNPYTIYLHDTPQKNLFNDSERAFSHGCIRVEKARELALALMQKDRNWTAAQTDAALQANKETTYSLQQKIPVLISYFTAWADPEGNVSFYNDLYQRDQKLYDMLY